MHLLAPRYNPVSPEAFNEQAFNVFYNVTTPPQLDDPLIAHQLALMFMVLAIGSLMDLARPAYNVDAEKYHQLARAALFQCPVFEEPTLSAVQALVSNILVSNVLLHHRRTPRSTRRLIHMMVAIVPDGLLSLPLRAARDGRWYAMGIYGARGQAECQCE